jgi:hypothetical protein
MPEAKIAELLSVHRNTITRDVAHLRNEAKSWLDELAKEDGFVYEYRVALEKIRDHEYDLQKLLHEADNVTQKVQVLRALDDNVRLYLELLGDTPTVHAFKRAIKKLQGEQDSRNSRS